MAINKKTAVWLANVCLWAYDFDEARENDLLLNGEAPLQTIDLADGKTPATSFAGIVEYNKVVVVAFQGTITEFGRDGVFRFDSVVDWIQNFKIKQLPTSVTGLPGKVHDGFYDQLDLIYDIVKMSLPGGKNKPLIITGHSQGGAVAILATKKFTDDGFKVKETYTFGAPRPGDSAFAKSVATPVRRIEFGQDLVPHVPPMLKQGGLFGSGLAALGAVFDLPPLLKALSKLVKRIKKTSYVSVGTLTYRSDDGKLMADVDAATEDKLFKKRKRGLVAAGKSLASHHGLAQYIRMFS